VTETVVLEEVREEPEEPRRRRGLLIALIALLAAIIIALVVVLVLAMSSSNSPAIEPTATRSATPTPTPTEDVSPTPTPTPTPSASADDDDDEPAPAPPPPPPSGPDARIISYTAPEVAGCYSPEAPAYEPSVPLTFTWTTQNVSVVAFGIGTNDAINAPYTTDLPPSGSITVDYQCSNASQTYTLTVAGADGVHVSKSITVRNPQVG